MKKLTKRITALFLAAALCTLALPVSLGAAEYVMPKPLTSVQINMISNAPNALGGGEEFDVTLTWKSVLANNGEPITLKTTNGAEILANTVVLSMLFCHAFGCRTRQILL